MTEAVLLDPPADPDQRINTIHAWVGTHANGAEGLLSADVDIPGGGTRHLPLMSAHLRIAEKLGTLARSLYRASQNGPQKLTSVELRTFVHVPRQ